MGICDDNENLRAIIDKIREHSLQHLVHIILLRKFFTHINRHQSSRTFSIPRPVKERTLLKRNKVPKIYIPYILLVHIVKIGETRSFSALVNLRALLHLGPLKPLLSVMDHPSAEAPPPNANCTGDWRSQNFRDGMASQM